MSRTLSLRLPVVMSSLMLWTACATPEQRLEQYQQEEQTEAKHLETFDTLDFDVFSHAKWDELSHSHSQDVLVHWPDGHTTQGLQKHIEDLKELFVYAPDTRIQVHPIKIASGEWTSVTGVMEGSFTKPMTLQDGTVIQPTGKSLKLPMNTVGRWKDGVMVEEYLFWDNQTFMRQYGLAK